MPDQYTQWPPESWQSEAAANADVGQIASGHASITGTGTINTGLAALIQTCVASLQTVTFGAGGHFTVACVPGGSAGQIQVTVYDSAGAQSTSAVVVHWFASDQE
jgi:hypothetical protein